MVGRRNGRNQPIRFGNAVGFVLGVHPLGIDVAGRWFVACPQPTFRRTLQERLEEGSCDCHGGRYAALVGQATDPRRQVQLMAPSSWHQLLVLLRVQRTRNASFAGRQAALRHIVEIVAAKRAEPPATFVLICGSGAPQETARLAPPLAQEPSFRGRCMGVAPSRLNPCYKLAKTGHGSLKTGFPHGHKRYAATAPR